MQGVQPAPAFANEDVGVVVARLEHLEEALGTTLLADQCAVAFGEGGGRQHEVGALGGGSLLVIGDDHGLGCGQGGVHLGGVGAAVEVVLEDDDRVGLAGGQGFQGCVHGFPTELFT